MGLFFNKKKENEVKGNQYLEDQRAVFETKGDIKPKTQEEDYDEYIVRSKDYSHIPKYKAFDENKVDVVVDREAIDFQDLKPEIATVNIEKKNLHEDLQEIMMGAPLDDETGETNRSIYDESLKDEIKKDDVVEVIDIENSDMETVIADIVEESVEKDQKLSIFGNTDEPVQAKVYGVKEIPVEPKIEIIDVDIKEEKEETSNIRFNEKGNKICPQCGAPLDPNAPVCFLCGNKF